MTEIQAKAPPARPANGRRPLMALDQRILEIAIAPMRPVQIADVLRREPAHGGIRTQRVAARLKALVNRDLMIRTRPSGAPRNGPGTSYYHRKPEEAAQADG
jgi:hypothetical protein